MPMCNRLKSFLAAFVVAAAALYLTPAVAALVPYGYAQRSAQVVAFLRAAARRESFTLLDARSLSVFAGTPADFFDGVHLQAPAMHRLLAWILRRAALPRS